MHFVVVADLVVAGFLVGANAWFFFIQSPALIAIMGREKVCAAPNAANQITFPKP